jgi:hypothetical protein
MDHHRLLWNRRHLMEECAAAFSRGRVFLVLASHLWSHCAWDPVELVREVSAERPGLLSRVVGLEDRLFVALLDPEAFPLPGVVAPGVTPKRLALEFPGPTELPVFVIPLPLNHHYSDAVAALPIPPAIQTLWLVHLGTTDDGPFGHRAIFGGRHGATYYWFSQEITQTVTAAAALEALGRATERRRT